MANYYYKDESSQELIEKVVAVNRSAKVVKGGRRFSFSALVVVGDGEGRVGIGFGKALEVSDAIAKALNDGRKSLVSIPRYRSTIPYEILGKFKGSKVLLKPATSGTGIIAGGAVRAVIESAGIRDILSKSLGSSNPTNMAKATINALASLMTKELAFKRRGKPLPVRKEAESAAAPVAQ